MERKPQGIRHLFPLFGHHDRCRIIRTFFGDIRYFVPESGNERIIYTETFCKYLTMSPEETLHWVILFGKKLPKTPPN